MKRIKAPLLAAILVAGCFPIELDVSKDGRILIAREEGFFAVDPATGQVTRVHAPAGGQPVFARFSPDGRQILAVTEGSGGAALFGSSGGHNYTVVTLADGASRVVFTGSNGTYTCWSPNGEKISLTRVADGKKPPLDENMPELHLINAKDGTKKLLGANVSRLHRWFPDSKAVLVFQIQSKDKKDNLYRGTLSSIDVASGEGKALANVVGSRNVFFDLSPDGTTVLFTARAAGKVGAELTPEKKARLFQLTVADGTVKPLNEGVKFAVFSPDGKRVLLGTDEKNSLVTLKVAGADLTTFTEVAAKAAAQMSSGMGPNTSIYPAWVGNDSVCYLTKTAVYGKAGENLALTVVGADGKNPKNLQAVIDTAALKTVE